MLAVASWLFRQGARTVCMFPDGMHAKQFAIRGWLETQGFDKTSGWGRTLVAGRYIRGPHTLDVDFRPGCGDVVAIVGACRILVEAKGGILNTTHSGQTSKLRRGLCEAVGMLMNGPRTEGADRLIAAVPRHRETEKLAQQMAPPCRDAGIEIALISATGSLQLITGPGAPGHQEPAPEPGTRARNDAAACAPGPG